MENEKKVELNDKELSEVSGGAGWEPWMGRSSEPHYNKCPKCGDTGGFYSYFSDFEREVECESCGKTYLQYCGSVPDPSCRNI